MSSDDKRQVRDSTRVKTLRPKSWQVLGRNAGKKFLKGLVTVRICGDVALVVTEDDSVYMVGDNVCEEDETEQKNEWNKKQEAKNKKKKKTKKKKKLGLLKIDFLCGRRITEFVIGGGDWPETGNDRRKDTEEADEERRRRPTRSSIHGRTNFYLALTESGDLYSWGVNNQGQLGRGGGGGEETSPARILSLSQESIVQVSAGTAHCLALAASGKVYGWGLNESGQCGSDKRVVAHLTPTQVQFGAHPPPIKAVYCGSSHSAALTHTGQVFCWGGNGRGQLGLGDLDDRPKPQLVVDLASARISCLAVGSLHTMALESETGRVYAWGRNDSRCLVVPSDESDITRPTLVNRLHRIDAIVAFHDSNVSLALKKKSTFIWGYQLQDNKPLKTPKKKNKTLLEMSYRLGHTPCFTTRQQQ